MWLVQVHDWSTSVFELLFLIFIIVTLFEFMSHDWMRVSSFTSNTCYVSNLVAICSCCTKRISSIKFISTISILLPGIDTKIEVRVAPPVTLERHEWRPRPLWPKNPCPWWRHQMEIFSTLLALCEWIHRSPVNSPHKGEWRGVWCFLLSLHE